VHKELPFEPCPFLSKPHQQTVFSSFNSWIPEPKSVQQILHLPDGDKIMMEVSIPEGWKETDPTVLCIHGLCGSHQSPYLLRLTNHLNPMNVKVVRFNMRGCGSGRGLARGIYHSGRCEDLFEAVKVLKAEAPRSAITLIGFSLGANITLKLMGELGSMSSYFVEKAIAISPPVDLFCSAAMLHEAAGGMYERYFYKKIRRDVLEVHRKHQELPKVHLPKEMSLLKFDETYTVPRFGFPSIHEYYRRCSAQHVIGEIDAPCKILFSGDDPIVSPYSLDHVALPSHVELYKTKYGGHMGYLGNPTNPRGFYWLDSVLLEWIFES
jgi:predicted alpha/beta-fold hydrolase